MTTATRPRPATAKLPAHGTQYRYRGPRNNTWPPCHCPKCTRAHTQACTRRELARLSGQPPLYPAGPVLQHIQTLNDSGMSNHLIARRANVAASTVNYLTRGVTKRLRRENALKILAVLPGDFDNTAHRPALGGMRRARALYAIGHNHFAIAAASGLDASTISHLANGHYQTIDGRTANAIATGYRKLRLTPGSSANAKRIARRAGWGSPIAWHDIDDPTAVPDPDGTATQEPAARKRDKLRNEEIEHLAGYGIDPKEIGRRLGLDERDVAERIKKWRKEARTEKQVAS